MTAIGCRKMKFESRGAAKAWNRLQRKQSGAPNLRPYICPDCGEWHLASSTPREARQAARKHGGRGG